MWKAFYNTICAAAVSLSALVSSAAYGADYPSLPAAGSISRGVLDNGITYYIVPNKSEKGLADICLVRRGGYGMEDAASAGSSAVRVMGALSELPRFRHDSPYRFLSRNHIWPGPEGYAEIGEDAVTYRFRDLNLSRSGEMVDSVLLLVFDIISREAESSPESYSAADQAIVVSGDIDAGSVLGKMNMLSLLVPKSRLSASPAEYSWKEESEAAYRHIPAARSGGARLTVEYASPRTSADKMSTILPLFSLRYSYELEIILRRRLSSAFREAGIPVAGLSFDYFGSSAVAGDEKTRISVSVPVEDIYRAAEVTASVLAGLDADGASVDEYRDAHSELLMNLRRKYPGTERTNSSYVEQCRAAYLYGASLATPQSVQDFFLSKNVDDSQGVRFFNGYVSALLDRSRNLTLECVADSSAVDGRTLLRTFDLAWKPMKAKAYSVSYRDTLQLKKAGSKRRTKLRAESAEPMFGGQTWVFDNGIRVIFKKVSGNGSFRFMWVLKGGYSLMPDLKPGEGAYVADMLGLYDVSGLPCRAFSEMLSANGILLGAEVTMSDFRVSGAAPVSRLGVLLRSLCAFTSDRSANKAAYDYYRKCQSVRCVQDRSDAAVIDSLLFPNNIYSAYRRPQTLAADFQARAERFFDKEFSKMNDGVLILVGDFDEYELKKNLGSLLGGFKTDKVSSYRSKARYQTSAGRVSDISEGDCQDIALGMSAPLTYSVENYMASGIAALALEDKVRGCLSSYGWNASAQWDFAMFPEERFTFTSSASMSRRTGLPASMLMNGSSGDVLYNLQNTLASFNMDNTELGIYKTSLKNRIASSMSDPETIVELLALRYSSLKDVVTKYEDKIGAVTLQSVNGIIGGLTGGRVAGFAVECPPDESAFAGEISLDAGISVPEAHWLPADDSLGVAKEAFRAIGLSGPDTVRFWLMEENFRAFAATLPEAAVPDVKPAAAAPAEVSAADSLTAGGAVADSLVTASDSLSVASDSLTTASDSLSVVSDSLSAAGGRVAVSDSLAVPRDSVGAVSDTAAAVSALNPQKAEPADSLADSLTMASDSLAAIRTEEATDAAGNQKEDNEGEK